MRKSFWVLLAALWAVAVIAAPNLWGQYKNLDCEGGDKTFESVNADLVGGDTIRVGSGTNADLIRFFDINVGLSTIVSYYTNPLGLGLRAVLMDGGTTNLAFGNQTDGSSYLYSFTHTADEVACYTLGYSASLGESETDYSVNQICFAPSAQDLFFAYMDGAGNSEIYLNLNGSTSSGFAPNFIWNPGGKDFDFIINSDGVDDQFMVDASANQTLIKDLVVGDGVDHDQVIQVFDQGYSDPPYWWYENGYLMGAIDSVILRGGTDSGDPKNIYLATHSNAASAIIASSSNKGKPVYVAACQQPSLTSQTDRFCSEIGILPNDNGILAWRNEDAGQINYAVIHGDSAANRVDEFEIATHLVTGTTTPGVSSCGTDPSISGTDMAMEVTVGSGTITSCTASFSREWTSIPVCVVTGDNTGVEYAITTLTGNTVVVEGSADMAGDSLYVLCLGR